MVNTGTRLIRSGIIFPLNEGTEVEQLEQLVKKNSTIRQEYINVLKLKPRDTQIVHYMHNVFTDDSLIDYNYNNGHGKRAMRMYDIFSKCFMDAYEAEELTEFELAYQLTLAIKQSRNRMRQRMFRARKIVKASCGKRKRTP
ncbi:uncharacterized protein LOC134285791 [Aedes albopictus]|uniref:DUF4806 domain-containing protein n=1 Tax=Aedes albopictus TaxID=7160 RepID=A0ABM1Z1A4_AEDAL